MVGTGAQILNPPACGRVEVILGQLDRLREPSPLTARLLAITGATESSTLELIEIVESDPTLTATIVRLVRRAHPGERAAMTARRAVEVLGAPSVRHAALAVQFHDALPVEQLGAGTTTRRKELWRHGLGAACAAELIAAELDDDPPSREASSPERSHGSSAASYEAPTGEHRIADGQGAYGEAFVCGLLHDVGKLALVACLPKSYVRVVEQVERRGRCIVDVERDVIGLDHTVAGKHLLERWCLPQAIADCAWLHHQSSSDGPGVCVSTPLLHIVHLADCLVRRERIGYSGYQSGDDCDDIASRLGLDDGGLRRVRSRLAKRMALFGPCVGLDEGRERDDAPVLLREVNRRWHVVREDLTRARRHLAVQTDSLAALATFCGELRARDRVGDVCVAAARCLRALCKAEHAVVLTRHAMGGCVHVGSCDAKSATDTLVFPETGAGDVDVMRRPLASAFPEGLGPATEDWVGAWQRCTGTAPRAPLWILPVSSRQERTGVGLVAAARASILPLLESPDSVSLVSIGIGMALASAGARVEAERMRETVVDMSRRLRVAQKEAVWTRSVSMIASMAAGAAHELNNPLSVISGRAQMELAHCDNAETSRTLQVIVDQASRAARIVTDLMAFAKPPAPKPELIALEPVLEGLCQHWCSTFSLPPESITVSLTDRTQTVYADAGQLRDILDAIVANAVEAAETKTVRVQINSPSRSSDETVRIAVSDHGAGMTQDVLEHAIDPFFSSRAAGRGQGLGLSYAYRLAELNGGRLRLESQPRRGTTVALELPARAPVSGESSS